MMCKLGVGILMLSGVRIKLWIGVSDVWLLEQIWQLTG
jgi:hypothetical protein